MSYFSEKEFNEYLKKVGFKKINCVINNFFKKFPYYKSEIREELFQEGCLALINLNNYYKDSSKLNISKFNLYAYQYITRAINCYISKNNDLFYDLKNEIDENGYEEIYDNNYSIRKINMNNTIKKTKNNSYLYNNFDKIDSYNDILIKNIEFKSFYNNFINDFLCDIEKLILEERLKGESYREIMENLLKNKKIICFYYSVEGVRRALTKSIKKKYIKYLRKNGYKLKVNYKKGTIKFLN